MFYGDNALRQLYKISLESSEMLAYFEAWSAAEYPHLIEIDDWHTKARVKAGIPIKIIIPDTKHAARFAKVDMPLKEVAIVPASQFQFKDLTLITDTHMLIYSLPDSMGVAIQSSHIAHNQKQQFLLAWQQAKQVGEYVNFGG